MREVELDSQLAFEEAVRFSADNFTAPITCHLYQLRWHASWDMARSLFRKWGLPTDGFESFRVGGFRSACGVSGRRSVARTT